MSNVASILIYYRSQHALPQVNAHLVYDNILLQEPVHNQHKSCRSSQLIYSYAYWAQSEFSIKRTLTHAWIEAAPDPQSLFKLYILLA